MHLTHLLSFASAFILANAQPSYPPNYTYLKRNPLAQVADSSTGVNITSASNPSSPSPTNNNPPIGSTASFTQYSPCNSPSLTACGWYSSTGFNATISQASYGGYPGSGPSNACGVCWKLTPGGVSGANEIVVKVNNLCPDGGNPLCAMVADVDINFDLCADSGAAAALFGSSGTEQVNGTAVVVGCDEWSGGADVS